MPINEFIEGQRVQLHPATDAWMQGDRYGNVVQVIPNSPIPVVVRTDSDRVIHFATDLVIALRD